MTATEPSRATLPDPDLELDAHVAAFEAAFSSCAEPDPASFLPPREHPLYSGVLRELLRVDLELAWSRGMRRRVEEYRGRFPDLFDDPAALADLVHEEYRLRKAAGETPEPAEYRDRLGIDLAGLSAEPTADPVCQRPWPPAGHCVWPARLPPGYSAAAHR